MGLHARVLITNPYTM